MPLKNDIEKVFNDISNKEFDKVTPEQLRKKQAEGIANAIKTNLKLWLAKGVPTPQDGGAGLKSMLLTNLDNL